MPVEVTVLVALVVSVVVSVVVRVVVGVVRLHPAKLPSMADCTALLRSSVF